MPFNLFLYFIVCVSAQGVPKRVTICPPKPQFLRETFEIFTVGRLLYSGFSIFSDLKKFGFFLRISNFDLGPLKSKIFKSENSTESAVKKSTYNENFKSFP